MIPSSRNRGGMMRLGLYGHFENLKEWSSGAHYSSELEVRELGWTGKFMCSRFFWAACIPKDTTHE